MTNIKVVCTYPITLVANKYKNKILHHFAHLQLIIAICSNTNLFCVNQQHQHLK
uniref:Uncharacterized protein n=1 Tax=Lotus japonicus TaxID=34305 RepID=I3SWQ2_LOTJA|nr:unknown [Lotus japonicus]